MILVDPCSNIGQEAWKLLCAGTAASIALQQLDKGCGYATQQNAGMYIRSSQQQAGTIIK